VLIAQLYQSIADLDCAVEVTSVEVHSEQTVQRPDRSIVVFELLAQLQCALICLLASLGDISIGSVNDVADFQLKIEFRFEPGNGVRCFIQSFHASLQHLQCFFLCPGPGRFAASRVPVFGSAEIVVAFEKMESNKFRGCFAELARTLDQHVRYFTMGGFFAFSGEQISCRVLYQCVLKVIPGVVGIIGFENYAGICQLI
jgi:hypothetical protein